MASALRATETRDESRAEATDPDHDIDRWYDADAVTFGGWDEPPSGLTARIDALRRGVALDYSQEADGAGLPRR